MYINNTIIIIRYFFHNYDYMYKLKLYYTNGKLWLCTEKEKKKYS